MPFIKRRFDDCRSHLPSLVRAEISIKDSTLRSSTRRGYGSVEVQHVNGLSAVTSLKSADPLKILVPAPRAECVQAYMSSFGGGMVAGDRVTVDIAVRRNARCFITTQASTKIYRCFNSHPCQQELRATLEEDAVLVLAPDPVQAFSDACYIQKQIFQLKASSGLVLLDWFSSGRSACGERWAFTQYKTRNDIFVDGRLSLIDSLLLDNCSDERGIDPSCNPASPERSPGFLHASASPTNGSALQKRFSRFNCFATLILMGPPLRAFSSELLADVQQQPLAGRAPVISSASPIKEGVLLRVAGDSVETVQRTLMPHLLRLVPLLQHNPWSRKW